MPSASAPQELRCTGEIHGHTCAKLLVKEGRLRCPRCKMEVAVDLHSAVRCPRCNRKVAADGAIKCSKCGKIQKIFKEEKTMGTERLFEVKYKGEIYEDIPESSMPKEILPAGDENHGLYGIDLSLCKTVFVKGNYKKAKKVQEENPGRFIIYAYSGQFGWDEGVLLPQNGKWTPANVSYYLSKRQVKELTDSAAESALRWLEAEINKKHPGTAERIFGGVEVKTPVGAKMVRSVDEADKILQ